MTDTTAAKPTVAFIGTGVMGSPMAGHLMDAGYPLVVFNRTKSRADSLVERGAVWAETPGDAAAQHQQVQGVGPGRIGHGRIRPTGARPRRG